MKLTRRDFLKVCGGTAGGVALLGMLGPESFLEAAPIDIPLRKRIGEKTTICCYCGVGCGAIMAVESGKIINIEGDPDHPINKGSLCPKGEALYELANSERRLKSVLYRSPGATSWDEKSWDWTIEQIAGRIKDTRDSNWISKDKDGKVVNRVEAIASVGSVFTNSEEAYLMTKLQRALGLVYIENAARICVSSAVAANSESFGRGPMSNSWIDLGNSDCVMIIGSNAAETFPVAFKWIIEAKEKGAKLIHVDPRFTRTSAKADIYARLRTGADVAFVGGMINYVLDDMEQKPENYNTEYVREYTNASFLINPDFEFEDGIFSGYDSSTRSYDKSSWQYQRDGNGNPKVDKSLQDPHCVFQLLKKHFSRYDVDAVCKITGTPEEVYLEVCRTFAATGAVGKAGAIVLSSGACQHTQGTQNVRAYGILQLLLGNMGVAGGGINGIAGASNGLGCSLQGRLFHWLPGTLAPPTADQQTLEEYVKANGHEARIVSLLKSWYGDNATAANDYVYSWLPKRSGNYSFVPLLDAIHSGTIKGLICWGMNPAVSGPNSSYIREALSKLDWMVVIDLWETETAAFWKRPGVDPASIDTDVFFLPAASSLEKEGSVCSSSRWVQWRYKGIEPPGEAMDDLWITNRLMLELKQLYETEGGPNADVISGLTWEYGDPPDVHRVAKEINGYDLETGQLVPDLTKLKADGTTTSGNWIFCGSYTEEGNMAALRDPSPGPFNIGLFPKWAWAWPLNRRIWYNRASVDLEGKPWDVNRPVIKWDSLTEEWIGDAPDGGWPPVSISGKYPFIMKPEGRAHLFGPGRLDGPLPEHYEPWESPVTNLMTSQQINPVLKLWNWDKRGTPDKYPILATTFRLVEHLHTGSFTRNLPWLVELMPEMFIEISEELANETGITNGEKVIVESARGEVQALAMVTKRLRPFSINGQGKIHQIAIPWNWGYMGLSKGDSGNLLTPCIADANTGIPELRAFLCNIRKA